MAALASDAMPELSVAAVHDVMFAGYEGDPFERAVILDARGEEYDIAVTDDERIGVLLGTRARNASALARAKESGSLGYRVEHVVAYRQGRPSVLVCAHLDGEPLAMGRLTVSQCSAVGTAIGALHRMDPSFLREEGFPVHANDRIRMQFAAWIDHLRRDRRVPEQITDRWHQLAGMAELWEFASVPVHGGFGDGDFMFGPQGIEAMLNWERLQVNDPARDLAWLFTGVLEPAQQDAVLSAYGRLMGSRMDSRIVTRAKLWIQMETVGDFVKALEDADSARIHELKERVDELAAELAPIRPEPTADGGRQPRHVHDGDGNTVTVGTLLRNGETMVLPESARPTPESGTGTATRPVDSDLDLDDLTEEHPVTGNVLDMHGPDSATLALSSAIPVHAGGGDGSASAVDGVPSTGSDGSAAREAPGRRPRLGEDGDAVQDTALARGLSVGDWIGGAGDDRPTGYVRLDDVTPSAGDDGPEPTDDDAAPLLDPAPADDGHAPDPDFQPAGNPHTAATVMLTPEDIAAATASATHNGRDRDAADEPADGDGNHNDNDNDEE